ncbi:MAG: hypothetical protein K0U10_02365 [Gammaproteobacteria bacterium]|nr:hypothetical protein [Gammaproteobacteria bacterium]
MPKTQDGFTRLIAQQERRFEQIKNKGNRPEVAEELGKITANLIKIKGTLDERIESKSSRTLAEKQV